MQVKILKGLFFFVTTQCTNGRKILLTLSLFQCESVKRQFFWEANYDFRYSQQEFRNPFLPIIGQYQGDDSQDGSNRLHGIGFEVLPLSADIPGLTATDHHFFCALVDHIVGSYRGYLKLCPSEKRSIRRSLKLVQIVTGCWRIFILTSYDSSFTLLIMACF